MTDATRRDGCRFEGPSGIGTGGPRLPDTLVSALSDLLAQVLVADLQQFPDLIPEDPPDGSPASQE